MLSIISDAEQHAMLQEVYLYVYNHPNDVHIHKKLTNNKHLQNIIRDKDFSQFIQDIMWYQTNKWLTDFIIPITLQFAYILKKTFGFKEPSLTLNYIRNEKIQNYNTTTQIIQHMVEFLLEYRQKFLKKFIEQHIKHCKIVKQRIKK